MGCSRLGTSEDKAAVQKEVAVAEARCVAPDCSGSEVRAAYDRGGMAAVRALQADKEAQLRAASSQAWNWGSPTPSANSWGSSPAPATHNTWSASPPVAPPASPPPRWSAESDYSGGGYMSNPGNAQSSSASGESSGWSPPVGSSPPPASSSPPVVSPPIVTPDARQETQRQESQRQEAARKEQATAHPDPVNYQLASPKSEWKDVPLTSLLAAANKPGDFQVQRTGNSLSIEGFLIDNRGADRSSQEKKLQDQVLRSAPADGQKWNAGHLIAHMFGGHGLDNLVLMLQRTNISYVGAVEKGISRELKGSDVYARVTVRLRPDGNPASIVHECYTIAGANAQANKLFEAETKLDWTPGQNLAEILKQVGQKWKDWVSEKVPEGAVIS